MRHLIDPGRRLGDYLALKEQRQWAFAQQVGTQQGIISRIVAGKMRPGLALAVRIERATDGAVPAVSWVPAEEVSE